MQTSLLLTFFGMFLFFYIQPVVVPQVAPLDEEQIPEDVGEQIAYCENEIEKLQRELKQNELEAQQKVVGCPLLSGCYSFTLFAGRNNERSDCCSRSSR